MSRLVVFGAGAIGGAVGGLLHTIPRDVLLVARGEHLRAMQRDGLHIRSPNRTVTVRPPVTERYAPETGDVVLLAVKSQDTEAALAQLAPGTPIVNLQNGPVGPDLCVRQGHPTLATMVWVPATRPEPGQVTLHGASHLGRIDVGPWRGQGFDAGSLTQDLATIGFPSTLRDEMVPWVYSKLLSNVLGIVQALTGELPADLMEAVVGETRAVLAKVGIPVVDPEVFAHATQIEPGLVDGKPRQGGSTWQSLQRGISLETRCLNGHIVSLAPEHAPLNARLVALAERAEAESWPPANMAVQELRAALIG